MKKGVYFKVKRLPYEDEYEHAVLNRKSLLRHLFDEHIPVEAKVGYNGACAGNVEIIVARNIISITWNPDNVDGRTLCSL